eukprot:1186255-Prorocentrum_minimum.AAC.2
MKDEVSFLDLYRLNIVAVPWVQLRGGLRVGRNTGLMNWNEIHMERHDTQLAASMAVSMARGNRGGPATTPSYPLSVANVAELAGDIRCVATHNGGFD